ncbi:protein kinase subdomain-containing protein [Phlyctema vagabunda]|uniref:Protein kinase subdomain-containing protein n=1 Tax=Phlyctema vagabunda TaxID=108571 RepID=A0ABR4PUB7_9HELO
MLGGETSWHNTDPENEMLRDDLQVGGSLIRCFKMAFGKCFDSTTDGHHESVNIAAIRSFSFNQLMRSDRGFSDLIQGILDPSAIGFGLLTRQGLEGSPTSLRAWFNLMLDRAAPVSWLTMHLQSSSPRNPLGQYTNHHVSQLIELWFQHHPLCIILSKTLILHGYRDGTHDQDLLLVILAYALGALDPEQNSEKTKELYHTTICSIWNRTSAQYCLSTIQIMLLLGWHHICKGDVREAYCFITRARTLVSDLHANPNSPGSDPNQWVNGIEVSRVDQEIRQNIYWISMAIELYMTMYMEISFTDPNPTLIEFPCPDASSSSLVALDKASGNVATLNRQTNLMRQLWPLAHITTVVAAIYVLHTKSKAQPSIPPGEDWQANIILKLHVMHHQPPTVKNLYGNIRKVLSDGMTVFKTKKGNDLSGTLVLCAFQIFLLHLQFPKPDCVDERGSLDDKSISEILESIMNFESLFMTYTQSIVSTSIRELDECSLLKVDCATLFVMGLDTCGMALDHLYQRCDTLTERGFLLSRQLDIEFLTGSLIEKCKEEHLRISTAATVTISDVKKRLKRGRTELARLAQTYAGIPIQQHVADGTGSTSWQFPDDYGGQRQFGSECDELAAFLGEDTFLQVPPGHWLMAEHRST